MNEWLLQLDINSVVMGLFAGLLIGLIVAFAMAKSARRKGADEVTMQLLPLNTELEENLKAHEEQLKTREEELGVLRPLRAAVVVTRLHAEGVVGVVHDGPNVELGRTQTVPGIVRPPVVH